MPCCKAKKYGWCEKLDTVYTDNEKNEYCLFHTPSEHKPLDLNDFNASVFRRVVDAIENNESCDFSATIFPGSISFKDVMGEGRGEGESDSILHTYIPSYLVHPYEMRINETVDEPSNTLPMINFTHAIFCGDADFENITFSNDAIFFNATFSKNAKFINATFRGDAIFAYSEFSSYLWFVGTNFEGWANFNGSTFNRDNGDSDFAKSIFSDYAGFEDTTFNGNIAFSRTTFSKNADFSIARFIKLVTFDDTTFAGDADFDGATFKEKTDFIKATFNSDVVFRNTIFKKLVQFSETTFGRIARFYGTEFRKKGLFHECRIEELMHFENVDLYSVSFLGSDPIRMSFQNCNWLQSFGRNILFDELEVKNRMSSYEQVETLYRRLKQKYKGEDNEFEASNWHYGEKEMFRKKKRWRRFNPVSFSNLYWASSGYGERPLRAGIMLLLLFAGVTFLMSAFGLITVTGAEKFGAKILKGLSVFFDWDKLWLLVPRLISSVPDNGKIKL